MANAVPLSAPDGTVYAYACGVCRHIHAGSCFLTPHDADQIAHLAGDSKDDAERCCRCEKCNTVAGFFDFGDPHVCASCLPAHEAEKEERDARIAAHVEHQERVQAERLRASKDETSARALSSLMSEISEECWCAGWLDGLEFSLWSMLVGDNGRDYGMGEVDDRSLADLRALSEKCGGWIRWEEDVGEVFVPAAEWQTIYAAHVSTTPPVPPPA